MNNKKVNLIELLKGKEGIELWSPIYGECMLKDCSNDKVIPYPITVSWIGSGGSHRVGSFTKTSTRASS